MENNIINRISEANAKHQAIVERAKKEYQQELQQIVHDFLEDSRDYFHNQLRLHSAPHSSGCIEIWNEDGKRVQRTFIAKYDDYKHKPRNTYKVQDEELKSAEYLARCITDLTTMISEFEQQEGGPMFEFFGLHFKGSHTMQQLRLDTVPEYVIKEMVDFGYGPQGYSIGGLHYWENCDDLRKEWNLQNFRQVSGTDYDVFYCMEDGNYYYPAEIRLSNVHLSNLEKNIKYWIKMHEEHVA